MRSSTHIIAEIGVNHNGSLESAKRLIDAAAASGADSVKFQFFEAESLATDFARLAEYQDRALAKGRHSSQVSMLKELELSLSELAELQAHAQSSSLDFFVSVFDHLSLEAVRSELCVSRLKIPSGEIDNERLIKRAAEFDWEVLISTGMSTKREVTRAVDWFAGARQTRHGLVVMQCTSSYPAASEDLNILALEAIKDEIHERVGFSDHSTGFVGAVAAVALGVEFIEKHLTLDRDQIGPDHQASEDPTTFANYCGLIREAELALGSGVKEPCASELSNRAVVRKSPYAISKIEPGDAFSDRNVGLFRPVASLGADAIVNLFGRIAKRSYKVGEPIAEAEFSQS